jgi:DnaJ-domain-containing protein 1
LKYITLARTFLAYTYSLAYEIENQNEQELFVVTQSLLEFSIERFDNFIGDHPIEMLMSQNEGKPIYDKFQILT